MAHYDEMNYPELLEHGDQITFTVLKRGLRVNIDYRVDDYYLMEEGSGENERIFTELGMTDEQKYDMAHHCYGYEPDNTGGWPEFDDMEGVTRLVRELLTMCTLRLREAADNRARVMLPDNTLESYIGLMDFLAGLQPGEVFDKAILGLHAEMLDRGIAFLMERELISHVEGSHFTVADPERVACLRHRMRGEDFPIFDKRLAAKFLRKLRHHSRGIPPGDMDRIVGEMEGGPAVFAQLRRDRVILRKNETHNFFIPVAQREFADTLIGSLSAE